MVVVDKCRGGEGRWELEIERIWSMERVWNQRINREKEKDTLLGIFPLL